MSLRGNYVPAQLQFWMKLSERLMSPAWRSAWEEPAKYLFLMPLTLEEQPKEEFLEGHLRRGATQLFRLLIPIGLSMGALDRCLLKAVSSLWRRLIRLSWLTNLEPAVVGLQSLRMQALPANPPPQVSVVLSSPLTETPLIQLFCGC